MRKITLLAVLGCAALLAADTFTQRQQQFWSFQKVQPRNPPAAKDVARTRNPIDQFILAKLEAKGIGPAAPADKITLLRALARSGEVRGKRRLQIGRSPAQRVALPRLRRPVIQRRQAIRSLRAG